MARFQPALEKLLRLEGGWCSVPGDRGGETYCGISRAHWPTWEGWTTIIKAKAHSSFVEGPEAFSEHLAGIPTLRGQVDEFYRKNFWNPVHGDLLPQELAEELFEQAVNMGVFRTVQRLQKLCNAFNLERGKPLFFDLTEDGVSGARTREAVDKVLAAHGTDMLLSCLNVLQAAAYITLAAESSSQRRFLRGWLKRALPGPAGEKKE